MKRTAPRSRLASGLAAGLSLWCAAAVAGNQAAFLAVTGYPAHARAVPMLAVATHPPPNKPPPNKPPAHADARQSGASFMSAATQALQNDDRQNPAMLWVAGGEVLWQAPAGKVNRSCASCHGDARQSMRGVAARYPAFDSKADKVVTLAQRIELCRQGAQQAAPLAPESDDLLSLEAWVGMQSRGMPMAPPGDDATRAAAERGRLRWQQRIGQLNLSCAQCHDDNWGRKLASAVIPQAHANAYPVYRLEWQALGSLPRRLRNCMNGVRAEAPPYGALELVELEAWLALRARGMPLETPGVRP
jgi:sulfur-oxidizing protein SoxA